MVGGGICITAALLIPVTAGLSVFALIPGALLGGAGGLVSGGADIGHVVVRNEKQTAAQEQLKLEKDRLEEIQELGTELDKRLDDLVVKYPEISPESIKLYVLKKIAIRMGLKITYKVMDHLADGGKALSKVYKTYKAMNGFVNAGRDVYKSYKIIRPFKSTLGTVLIAMDVVTLPIDLVFMGYSAHKVHKYRQGERISDVAEKLDEVAEQLKYTKSEIQEQLNLL